MNIEHLRLYLVTQLQNKSLDLYLSFIQEAIAGGVTAVQLREKNLKRNDFLYSAKKLKDLLSSLHTPLIINDHVDIAKEIDADGVHLGQSDISPDAARTILGPNKWIGLSIESLGELEIANTLTNIDYIAASAVFQTKTKLDCKHIWGLEGLTKVTSLSKHPVIAIGGITVANVQSVIQHGASGVAIISAIHDHANPKQSAQEIMMQIQKIRG